MFSRSLGIPHDSEFMLLHAPNPPPEEDTQNFFKWIQNQFKMSLSESASWYFLRTQWLKKFKHWAWSKPKGSKVPEPGPIDITGLGPMDDIPEDTSTYSMVPEDLWKFMVKRYGILDNREPVARQSYTSGICKEGKVERRLQQCTLLLWDRPDEPRSWKFSIYDKKYALEWYFKRCFRLPRETQMRIWVLYDKETDTWDVIHGAAVCIANYYKFCSYEWRNTFKAELLCDGAYPSSVPPAIKHHHRVDMKKGLIYHSSLPIPGEEPLPGALSYTVEIPSGTYRAACIKMLAHVPSIRSYYTTDTHLRELNPENPLGRKGQFAERFGDIIKRMWYPRPEDMYMTITRFEELIRKTNSMYDTLDLMDANQFLLFLLDALHEDCNRVKEKPMVTLPDSANRPVADVAADFWDGFKQRNDSVVVDTFFSLVHNTSTCMECNIPTNTFEALPSITLPIAIYNSLFKVVFRPYDVKKPLLVTRILLNTAVSVETAQRRVAEVFGVEPFTFSLGFPESMNFKNIIKECEKSEPFSKKWSQEAYLLALEHPPDWKLGMEVRDVENQIELSTVRLSFPWLPTRKAWKLGMFDEICTFTVPYLVKHSFKATYDEWMNIVVERLKDILPQPAEGDEWWKWKSPEDDEYDRLVEKYKEISRGQLKELPLDSGLWEKDGKHYYIRFRYQRRLFSEPQNMFPKDGEAMLEYGGEVIVEIHRLYARRYLQHLINYEPNVKMVGDWWLPKPEGGLFTLQECLQLWNQDDSMGMRNLQKCKHCDDMLVHIKKTGFWFLPNYLILHMNRFDIDYNDRENGGILVDAMLKIPEDSLDMRPYVTGPLKDDEETLYDLKAVIMHIGHSILQASYIFFVKHERDGNYYRCAGNAYPSFPEEVLQHRGIYMLLYKRRGFEDYTFPAPEGGATAPGPLQEPVKMPRLTYTWGPRGMMMIHDDSPIRIEQPTINDAELDASILRLKAKGISTKRLEGIRDLRRAAKEEKAGPSPVSSKAEKKPKSVLDSDPSSKEEEEKEAEEGASCSCVMLKGKMDGPGLSQGGGGMKQ